VPTSIIGPNEADEPDSKSIRIATMHRAKGLEFDEVVLMLAPGFNSQSPGASDQRCLTYVALTRAKKMATIIRISQ
jgi:superfamily I DNA/RNA helicase